MFRLFRMKAVSVDGTAAECRKTDMDNVDLCRIKFKVGRKNGRVKGCKNYIAKSFLGCSGLLKRNKNRRNKWEQSVGLERSLFLRLYF